MSRREEIRVIHTKYGWLYGILLYIVVLAIGIVVGANFFRESGGYDPTIWTEVLGVAAGAGVTAFVLDRFNERRSKEREKEELRVRLRRESRSGSNDIDIGAIEELRHLGWLRGTCGLLKGADLIQANFKGASLGGSHP